jgi:hypothetical protein
MDYLEDKIKQNIEFLDDLIKSCDASEEGRFIFRDKQLSFGEYEWCHCGTGSHYEGRLEAFKEILEEVRK